MTERRQQQQQQQQAALGEGSQLVPHAPWSAQTQRHAMDAFSFPPMPAPHGAGPPDCSGAALPSPREMYEELCLLQHRWDQARAADQAAWEDRSAAKQREWLAQQAARQRQWEAQLGEEAGRWHRHRRMQQALFEQWLCGQRDEFAAQHATLHAQHAQHALPPPKRQRLAGDAHTGAGRPASGGLPPSMPSAHSLLGSFPPAAPSPQAPPREPPTRADPTRAALLSPSGTTGASAGGAAPGSTGGALSAFPSGSGFGAGTRSGADLAASMAGPLSAWQDSLQPVSPPQLCELDPRGKWCAELSAEQPRAQLGEPQAGLAAAEKLRHSAPLAPGLDDTVPLLAVHGGDDLISAAHVAAAEDWWLNYLP